MAGHVGKQAIVVGAGMGGLTAALALADHFERIVILESDGLPADLLNRAGTPQGRHVHALLAGGQRALEGARKTLEVHLADARDEERQCLRRGAHNTQYSVFGAALVRRPRDQSKSGRPGRAIATIQDVTPLIRGASFEHWMLAAVARDFLVG